MAEATVVLPKETMRALTDLTGEARTDVALMLMMRDYARQKLAKIDAALHRYEEKYGMPFEYDASQRCNKPVLKVNGSGGTTLGGVCYAPNGQIAVSGSGIMNGSFLGDSVDLAGSELTINLPPPIGYPAGCEAYDVLSDAEGSSTTSRVLYCDGEFSVMSWWLQ